MGDGCTCELLFSALQTQGDASSRVCMVHSITHSHPRTTQSHTHTHTRVFLQAREAKAKEKKLKDAHSTGLNQIDVMNDLVQLLQVCFYCVCVCICVRAAA